MNTISTAQKLNSRKIFHRVAAGIALTAISLLNAGCSSGPSNDNSLQSLIPAPPSSQRTNSRGAIQNSGTHAHFSVEGAPNRVLDAYKAELENEGWSVTGKRPGGRNGATYTATNGHAYGVFTGGGYGSGTDIDACVWPSRPSNTYCGN